MMGYEVEGVTLSRDRLIHGMEFQETAELELDLGAMGIRTFLPVLDRYSPLSYSIAQHIQHSQASWSRELGQDLSGEGSYHARGWILQGAGGAVHQVQDQEKEVP